MRVEIDYAVCAATGQCALTAPSVFRVEHGQTFFEAEPPESEREAVEDAAESCPVQAIRVEES